MMYEMLLKGTDCPIMARDSSDEELIGWFANYDEFRSQLPGAEIALVEQGNGTMIVYC